MSNRDRVLVYILVLLLVAVVPFYFLARPLISNVKTMKNDLRVLTEKRDAVMAQGSKLTEKEKKYNELSGKLKQYESVMPSPAQSYDAHYTFTELAAKDNLRIRSLAIGEVTPSGSANITVEGSALASYQRASRMQLEGSMNDMLRLATDIDNFGSNFKVESFGVSNLDQNSTSVSIETVVYMALGSR